MLDDAGLGISGVAAPFPSPATSPKDKYLDTVKGHMDMCRDMGSPSCGWTRWTRPTAIPGGMDYETCFATVAEGWHHAAELCAKQA